MASITLDVRPLHEAGVEPFDQIMQAVRDVGPGEHFVLINSFDPVPLYAVLGRNGFTHETREVGPAEWHIDFVRSA
jgi:uncharacterized protein (DUF2249 family)